MIINFCKYNSLGNDFIIIDDRKDIFNTKNKPLINFLCDRHNGIGADGLILVKKSINSDFEILHFDPNGNLGSLCGNGSRCAVQLAYSKDFISRKTSFTAFDGIHNAELLNNGLIKMDMKINSNIIKNSYGTWVDTGSPHLVIEKANIDKLNVNNEGRLIRYNNYYKKDGVNVNFIEKISNDNFKIRTYERGVERETLACGTGSTASALCMFYLERTNSNSITMQCKGGNLNIQFKSDNKYFKEVSIIGPANFVFEGNINTKI
mgnify:FL=1